MFDGNKKTSFSFKGQFDGFIGGDYGGDVNIGQLLFNFGRKIKPRKIILSYALNNQI